MKSITRFIYFCTHLLPISIFLFFTIISLLHVTHSNALEKPPVKIVSQEKEEIPDWLARWELAKALSYSKRYEESVLEYKKLLKEKPDFHQARAELANVLFWQGKNDESLAVLEQIPTKYVDNNTGIIMAELYSARKEYAKAEPLYRKYINKNPEDVKARLKLAEMLSWMKRYNESVAEYKIILDTVPNDIQVRRKYAFVLIWAGRHTEAAAELKKTLK